MKIPERANTMAHCVVVLWPEGETPDVVSFETVDERNRWFNVLPQDLPAMAIDNGFITARRNA